MKKLIIIITLIVAIGGLMGGTSVFAQDVNYVPLAPIPGTGVDGCDPSTGSNCSVDISNYIPKMFTILIGIAGVLAILMIMIGGIQYISSDAISGKEDGKKRIQNALWGLLLALGSFAILSTINSGALSFNLEQIKPTESATTTGSTGGGDGVTGNYIENCEPNFIDRCAWPSDASTRASLQNAGISIASSLSGGANCAFVGQLGCTSVYGLGFRATDGLSVLKENCGLFCEVTITGGTEYWLHGSNGSRDINANDSRHKPGNNVVDIRKSSSNLNSFIINNGTSLGTQASCSSLGPAWRIGSAIYVDEGDHWHVCF